MGRATRWLRSLLMGKKDGKDPKEKVTSCRKEKKRWSFGKSEKDAEGDAGRAPANPAWLRSFCSEREEERNKRTMAVAAATAAAADAAVAAAQAAVAVVRLTSKGRGAVFGGARERWAATKIQAFFRGYLVCSRSCRSTAMAAASLHILSFSSVMLKSSSAFPCRREKPSGPSGRW